MARRPVNNLKEKPGPLLLPATLVVVALALAPSCSDDAGDSSGDTDSPAHCSDIVDMAACEDAGGCGWTDECTSTCHTITSEGECTATGRCQWDAAHETGTGELTACHEPFT